jgi:SAM-dependent methyltransferase
MAVDESSALDLTRYSHALRRGSDGVWTPDAARAVSYPEHGNRACFAVEDGSFWFSHRNRVLDDLLARYPPAGPVFDVGGGNGFVARALERAGHAVVLVEPGPEGVRNAAGRGLSSLVRSTFEDAGFLDDSLPAASLFDVLEHVGDDVGFLASVARRLRPRGRLYLTVPAHAALWSADDAVAGHHRRYSSGSLGRALAAAGFELEWSSHFFVWLAPAVALLRALPSRLGRRRADDVARVSAEHAAPAGAAGRFLERRLAAERRALSAGRRFRIGSSLAAVARRADAAA